MIVPTQFLAQGLTPADAQSVPASHTDQLFLLQGDKEARLNEYREPFRAAPEENTSVKEEETEVGMWGSDVEQRGWETNGEEFQSVVMSPSPDGPADLASFLAIYPSLTLLAQPRWVSLGPRIQPAL